MVMGTEITSIMITHNIIITTNILKTRLQVTPSSKSTCGSKNKKPVRTSSELPSKQKLWLQGLQKSGNETNAS